VEEGDRILDLGYGRPGLKANAAMEDTLVRRERNRRKSGGELKPTSCLSDQRSSRGGSGGGSKAFGNWDKASVSSQNGGGQDRQESRCTGALRDSNESSRLSQKSLMLFPGERVQLEARISLKKPRSLGISDNTYG